MIATTRLRMLLALGAAMALVLVACGDDDAAPDEAAPDEAAEDPGDLELAEDGMIEVGTDADFAPFEFVEDGEFAGFDIDLFTEVADRLGHDIEFVNTPFDGIITALAGGQFDALISAMTITDERAETISFSDPYFAANQALSVLADADLASVDDLTEGTVVGAQAGTTGLDYAYDNFEEQGTEIREFPTSGAAFDALEGDQLDAVFIDLPAAGERVDASGGAVEVAEEVDTGELYGIGVPQESENLLAAINDQLADIIDDGTYADMYGEWFEGDVPEQFQ